MVVGRRASPLGSMDSLPELARLGGGAMELAQVLEGLGWTVQRLATLADATDDELDDVVGQAEETAKKGFAIRLLKDLVELTVPAARIAWKAEGRAPEGELMQAHLANSCKTS